MISRRLAWSLAAAVSFGALVGGPAELEAQQNQEFVIAVLPFSSPDDEKAKDLQEEMIEELTGLGDYTLVDQDDVNDALKGQGFTIGAAIPDPKTLEIASALNANVVARGRLEQNGGQWRATPTFVEVATRNTQSLPPISASDVKKVGDGVVEAFNVRNQADKHVIFGRDYIRSENWERAIANFQQALEYDPELAAAYYWMGDVQLRQGQVQAALAALEKAVEIDPAYISAYHSIGSAYLEKGDTTQARNFFEQLVAQKANDCDVQIAYGYVMANQLDEVDKGLAAFERAKQLCPDNPAAFQYLAYALPNDRRDEKIENFKRYLDLAAGGETDPEALTYLFSLYFAEEQYDEARRTAEQALAADPSNARLLLAAGYVHDKLGQYQQAIDYYNRALAIDPNLERAYLFRALANKELGNMAAFANDLEKAGRGQSSEIMANIFLREAATSLKAGRAGVALEQVSRAQQLGGNSCAIAYYRGDAYYQMGKAMQGEDKTIPQNERAKGLFNQAIASLRGACGEYASYGQGLSGNASQYIERIDLIIKKLSRGR